MPAGPEGSIKYSVMPAGKKTEKKCFSFFNRFPSLNAYFAYNCILQMLHHVKP